MSACMAASHAHGDEARDGPREHHTDDEGVDDDALSSAAPFLPDGSPNLFWRTVDMEVLRSQQQPRFVGLPPAPFSVSLEGTGGGLEPRDSVSPCCPWAFR